MAANVVCLLSRLQGLVFEKACNLSAKVQKIVMFYIKNTIHEMSSQVYTFVIKWHFKKKKFYLIVSLIKVEGNKQEAFLMLEAA